MSIFDRFTKQEPELDIDVALKLLKNERRRLVFDAFGDDETVTTRELAESIAAVEVDRVPDSDERNRVYIALYQEHLPRMDEAGVLEQHSPNEYSRGEHFDELERVLETVREVTR